MNVPVMKIQKAEALPQLFLVYPYSTQSRDRERATLLSARKRESSLTQEKLAFLWLRVHNVFDTISRLT